MPYQQLQDMLSAYTSTIGKPFRGWDMADVLRVFSHCANTTTTWQKQICDVTGVSPAKVNRVIDAAEKSGWVKRPKSRTSDARKPLRLTTKGRSVATEFERLCREAVGPASRDAASGVPEDPIGETLRRPAKKRPKPDRHEPVDFDKVWGLDPAEEELS